ncbi:hypothetical protein ARAM_002941 [Aspergillus rambellii]|uniref:Rhodopsin domain-containing protein n=1 Tax=Aspergillus rambellii TaxID=308745 RepID=A0A0F8UIK6_9EURO|nr:hypothetical protein ARAM_002941 [Aspergillus rambellii]
MSSGRSNAILISTSVLLGISLVTVCLRCYVRLRIVKAFGWDDSLMVTAMIFNIGFAICGIIGTTYGIGKKAEYFQSRPDDFQLAMLYWWLAQLFYVVTCTMMRMSIAVMLLRLVIDRVFFGILYGVMALSTIAGLIFFFFTIFQCTPVAYYWGRLTMQGKCLNTNTLLGIAYFYSAAATACDLTIGILPAVLIWNLRISHRAKLGIAVILGIGCMLVLLLPSQRTLLV